MVGAQGWSFEDYDTLDLIENGDIKATRIIDCAASYVRRARVIRAAWFIAAALIACVAALALGLAAAWVHRGFQSEDA